MQNEDEARDMVNHDYSDNRSLPEECSLPFQQQIENIKAAYSDVVFKNHPLLPPYKLEEVYAMEDKYSFSFPPLLRFYILNISRETSFSTFRSLVQPEMCYPWYNKTRGDRGDKRTMGTWSCHVADNGREVGETIWFSGRLRGFVQFADDVDSPHMGTLYDRMILANPKDVAGKHAVFFVTLEETLQKCGNAVSTLKDDPDAWEDWFDEEFVPSEYIPELNEIKDAQLPDELKGYYRDSTESVCIILGHVRIRKIVEDCLNEKARMIQRQFRLWKWRKDVLWNPYTDIGRLNLMTKARTCNG